MALLDRKVFYCTFYLQISIDEHIDCPEHSQVEIITVPVPEISRGMGLADIEARVRALGGTCTYGPNGPGWRVFASIPKRDSAPSEV